MLTTEAFNALLKTLEEPPERVVFVLCTTEIDKLPETIVSRCVRIGFRKGNKDDIVHAMLRVVEGEKLQIGEGVLEMIADQAKGSFRDAHKILEQLSWKAGKIELDQVKERAGVSEQRVDELAKLLANKDIGAAIGVIEEIMKVASSVAKFGSK
jgi:DNA polymerase-3 subunit gamma/tau